MAKKNGDRNKGKRSERDRILPTESADQLIDHAFPTGESEIEELNCRPVFAVIPPEAFSATADEFSSFLEGVFESEDDLDATLDRALNPVQEAKVDSLARRVRALVPVEVMDSVDPTAFVDDIFNAFDEIDEVLSSLREESPSGEHPVVSTTAVVPEESIADPLELIRAIDRVQTEAEKLNLLFRQAKHTLRQLRAYRLSRRPAGQVLSEMRQANHIPTLQYLIDFLNSVLNAAESFEKIELPRPHIRDYLEYLYRMEDWDGMSHLVKRLQGAVERYLKAR
jgi:hypothetical protein